MYRFVLLALPLNPKTVHLNPSFLDSDASSSSWYSRLWPLNWPEMIILVVVSCYGIFLF